MCWFSVLHWLSICLQTKSISGERAQGTQITKTLNETKISSQLPHFMCQNH